MIIWTHPANNVVNVMNCQGKAAVFASTPWREELSMNTATRTLKPQLSIELELKCIELEFLGEISNNLHIFNTCPSYSNIQKKTGKPR